MVCTQKSCSTIIAGKEREDIARRQYGYHLWEECGQQSGKDPVSEAAESLTFRAMAVGKDLGNEYPNHGALSNGVRCDESENADGNDRVMAGEESPSHQSKRGDVTEGSDI